MKKLMPTTKQKLSTNLLLLFLSLCVGFVGFELIGRVYFFGWSVLWPPNHNSIPYIGNPHMTIPSSIPNLRRELAPNLDTRFKKVKFITNSQGLRDKEYSLKKSPNTFRVVVIGDSATLPAGVAIEDAYHSILEERLNKELETTNVEFINFGVSGYSINDYELIIRTKALLYEPDMVILGIASNDYLDMKKNSEPNSPPPSLLLYNIQRVFRSSSITKIQQSSWRVGDLHAYSGILPRRKNFLPYQPHMKKYFEKIVKHTNDQSIPLVVVILDYLQLDPQWIIFWEDLARKNGAHFVNTTTAFHGHNPYQYMIYRADRHSNAKANLIFADVLYNFLRKQQLVPELK